MDRQLCYVLLLWSLPLFLSPVSTPFVLVGGSQFHRFPKGGHINIRRSSEENVAQTFCKSSTEINFTSVYCALSFQIKSPLLTRTSCYCNRELPIITNHIYRILNTMVTKDKKWPAHEWQLRNAGAKESWCNLCCTVATWIVAFLMTTKCKKNPFQVYRNWLYAQSLWTEIVYSFLQSMSL